MSEKLIKVAKSDGESLLKEDKAFRLDPGAYLPEIRARLEEEKFMSDEDSFFLDETTAIPKSEEAKTVLAELLQDGKPLIIGRKKADLGESTDGNLQRYLSMLPEQKIALFNRLQIYRGLTMNEKGLDRCEGNALTALHEDQLPVGDRVAANDTSSDHAFNEWTKSLVEKSVDTGSVSLSTPFGGGEASFEHMRSKSTDSKTVTEYLVGKVLIQKIRIKLKFKDLTLTKAFEDDLQKALLADGVKDDKVLQAQALVNALNELGFYVPWEFTLGGALLTTTTTKITEFKQVNDEKDKFEAGVNASYEGISGGAKGSHSEEKKAETSESHKYENLSFRQMSGPRAVDTNELKNFLDALESSVNWDVIVYHKLCPTLALLSSNSMRNYCLKLLDNYGTYPQLMEAQPYLNLIHYSTESQTTYLQNKPQ